jgi:hypothetical protein
MDKELEALIKNVMEQNENASIEELNEKISVVINERNNRPLEDFEGLSPEQMRLLLYFGWEKNGIIINPDNHSGDNIPMIKQIKYFINIIESEREIKLTKTGNLPPAIVKDIYRQGIITDYGIELGMKINTEQDVNNISMMKILCTETGLIKKRNGRISLTKKAMPILSSTDFLNRLFEAACYRFNWAYLDRYIVDSIGQFGFNYSFYLLKKYGSEWQGETFYADLYFKAFKPFKKDDDDFMLQSAYTSRTFHNILKPFGFIEYENKKMEIGNIRTTALFGEYIKVNV